MISHLGALNLLVGTKIVSKIAWCPEGLWQLVILVGWAALVVPGFKFFSWLLQKAPRGILSYVIFFFGIPCPDHIWLWDNIHSIMVLSMFFPESLNYSRM